MTIELRGVAKTVGRAAAAHPSHRSRPAAGRVQRPARGDALGQDHADAPHGGARQADRRPDPVPRRGRHRRPRAEAQRLHGLPAVHQLPEPERLREHRIAVAGGGHARERDRRAGRRGRGAARTGPRCSGGARRSSPGGSSSAPRWPGRWSRTPASSCSTSRSPNLDYKLREELREELPGLLERKGATIVYATSEPQEALLLGGCTATLHEGRITQFGPTPENLPRPKDLVSARVFSDPPLNVASAVRCGDHLRAGRLRALACHRPRRRACRGPVQRWGCAPTTLHPVAARRGRP